jgi:alpha-tubulin suppressor-like RCC1 family protein
MAGVAVAAAAPAQAGIVFQSHVMAGCGAGLLGDGGTGRSLYGDIKAAGNNVVQVAGGWYRHHLTLRSDGTVWAWGRNDSGQLGDGTTTGEGTPVQVTGLTGVTQVAAGFDHSLALKSDGTVWAWGNNDHGQLGNGTSVGSPLPVQVPRLDHVTQISAGYGFSLALRSNGTVWAWGDDTSGQLGNAPSSTPVTRPVNTIGLGSGIIQLSAGGAHVLALKSNGTVLAWGNNQLGQLGIGSVASVTGSVQVIGLVSATQVAAGLDVSFAVHTVPYLVGL